MVSSIIYAQNDSILPNQYAFYHTELLTIDFQQNFVWTPEDIYFVDDTPNDDTISVIHNNDTIATLALSGDSVFIKRTAYQYNTYYINDAFDPGFGTGFELLYDFTLNVGDTAWYQFGSPVVVISISYIDVQGEMRRSLNMDTGESWIQGLGSTLHPLAPKLFYFENNYSLCSAQMEYSGISPVDTASYNSACNLTNSINEYVLENSITVSPNPTSEYITIETSSDSQFKEISIYNLQGVEIESRKITSSSVELNLTNYSKGIYIYRLKFDNNVYVKGKIMKQ